MKFSAFSKSAGRKKTSLSTWLAFTAKNSPKDVKKKKETGAGAFKVCLVYDNNPQYADGKNANIVKSKQDYRQLTGGGNLVHASDNLAETNENLLFLFGKTVKDLEQEGPRAEICVVRRDLVGCPVWDSLQQALDTVRKNSLYPGKSL